MQIKLADLANKLILIISVLAYIKFGDEVKSPNRQIKTTVKCTMKNVKLLPQIISNKLYGIITHAPAITY